MNGSSRNNFILVFKLLLLFFLVSSPAIASEAGRLPFDHSAWDRFLKKFVNEKGEVDYERAHSGRRLLDVYFRKLKSIPLKPFINWPREEKMAVSINAYNAGVVRLVLDRFPLKSVTDIPGVWENTVIPIGNSMQSLNQIQENLLRRQFRDERTLFALSSGARGSPRLRREAYTGAKVEGQLYLAARDFVNDSSRNRIERDAKKVILSRLFKWYAKDFVLNWSNFPGEIQRDPQEMAVLSFMAHYLEDPAKVEFLREGTFKVKYENFDWRLNESPKSGLS